MFSYLAFWFFRLCGNNRILVVSSFYWLYVDKDKCCFTETYEPVNSTWTSERCAVCRMVEDWHHNKMIICNRYNFLVLLSCFLWCDYVCVALFCENLDFDTSSKSWLWWRMEGWDTWSFPCFFCIELTFLFHWPYFLAWWCRCQVAVHEECYGVKASESVGSWVCSACETPDIERECCLCPVKG